MSADDLIKAAVASAVSVPCDHPGSRPVCASCAERVARHLAGRLDGATALLLRAAKLIEQDDWLGDLDMWLGSAPTKGERLPRPLPRGEG